MKQVNVLVIDDDPSVRFILAKYIKALGHTVIEASSGEEARTVLLDHSRTIDLALSDIWMPQMSGIELLKSLRQLRPELPVAIITGSATLDTSIAAVNLGAYAYLTKPLQKEQIQDVISRGLSKRDEYLAQHSAGRGPDADFSRDQAEKMVAELIRGLRHELGNTATAIKLNLFRPRRTERRSQPSPSGTPARPGRKHRSHCFAAGKAARVPETRRHNRTDRSARSTQLNACSHPQGFRPGQDPR